MSLSLRVIPCLDVANGRVVKGVKFQNLKDSGDVIELATRYYEEGADELTFLDILATVEDRGVFLELVSRTAECLFVPLTVGGGISSVDDVARLLGAGADKVSVGSAGISNPKLLDQISRKFGNQVLVVSLDIKSSALTSSGYTVMSHGGKVETGIDAFDWVSQVEGLGAGELLVNSIDSDGTKSGYNLDLIRRISAHSNLPLIASGGAGRASDFPSAAAAGADAILAASVFHTNEVSIMEAKLAMRAAGFQVRLPT